MAKTKAQKQQIVSDLEAKIKESAALYVVDPKALNPNEAASLKKKMADLGAELHLVKNSLFNIALKNLGLEADTNFSSGQNAVVFVENKEGADVAAAAKVIKEFNKESEKTEFKGGYLESKLVSMEDVKTIADLPGKQQLIAQVIGTMNAPISSIVNVLAANIRGVVTVIDAIRSKKELA